MLKKNLSNKVNSSKRTWISILLFALGFCISNSNSMFAAPTDSIGTIIAITNLPFTQSCFISDTTIPIHFCCTITNPACTTYTFYGVPYPKHSGTKKPDSYTFNSMNEFTQKYNIPHFNKWEDIERGALYKISEDNFDYGTAYVNVPMIQDTTTMEIFYIINAPDVVVHNTSAGEWQDILNKNVPGSIAKLAELVKEEKAKGTNLSAAKPYVMPKPTEEETTTFSVDLVEAAHVRLAIVDAAGKEFMLLHDQQEKAGKFSKRFSLSNVKSKEYSIKCSINGNTMTVPFMFVE